MRGCICLHNRVVYHRFSVRPMTDNDKHIIVTAIMSFFIGLLCAVALRLQGVAGVEYMYGADELENYDVAKDCPKILDIKLN